MKRLVLLLVCFLKLQAEDAYPQKILMHAPATVETRLTSWSETDDMGKPYSTLFGQKDVNNSTASFSAIKTIDRPGRYYLTESIQINPLNSYVICFKITCSNVILDLRGHAITGDLSRSSGIIAIQVDSLLSNVVICNGDINAINGQAIQTGLFCNNIVVKNMTITNCFDVGINFTGLDSSIENVKITNCSGQTGSLGGVGLFLNTANRIKIKNCKFDNNQAYNFYGYGVYAVSSNYLEFINCTANQNSAPYSSSEFNAYGFNMSGCNNLIFKNCEALGNTCSTGTAYGFLLSGCSNIEMYDCEANLNQTFAGRAYGFTISSSNRSLLRNCKAFGNTSTDHVYGFMASQANYSIFENCQAIGQFSFAVTSTSAGFCSLGSQGSVFKDCVANGNTASSYSESRCIGFYLSENDRYARIDSCIAQSNDGVLSGTGYGIFLDGTQRCIIKNNQLYGNLGGITGYGIRDSSSSSMSMFIQNFAYGNGSTSGSTVNNYDVKPSPTDTTNAFPVKIGYLTNFAGFDTANSYHNLELIEQSA